MMLVEGVQRFDEKYTSDNSALLRYLGNEQFDPYHAWYEVCEWIADNGYLDELNDATGNAFESAEALQEEDAALFYQLEPHVQKQCAEEVLDQMMRDDPANAPSNSHMTVARERLLPRTTWLVHFTDDPDGIGYNGFQFGMGDMERLGLTTYYTDEAKKHGGYNFAFLAGSRDARSAQRQNKYGRHAVLFQHSGVLVDHHGDEEKQVIFYGREVDRDSIVILKHRDDGWNVVPKARLKSGRDFLFKGDFDACVGWVEKNFVQYRRALIGR